jgi:hypothetical protein
VKVPVIAALATVKATIAFRATSCASMTIFSTDAVFIKVKVSGPNIAFKY